MSFVKNTLQENYIFFLCELTRIEHKINNLPIRGLPQEFKKSIDYLKTLPPRWQRTIKEHIKNHLPEYLNSYSSL